MLSSDKLPGRRTYSFQIRAHGDWKHFEEFSVKESSNPVRSHLTAPNRDPSALQTSPTKIPPPPPANLAHHKLWSGRSAGDRPKCGEWLSLQITSSGEPHETICQVVIFILTTNAVPIRIPKKFCSMCNFMMAIQVFPTQEGYVCVSF